MALFAIPFRSVRSRPGTPGWGIVLSRNIPRNSETDSWPHIATSITGTLTQEGTLHGIEGVTGSHNLQLNPYILGQNEHTLLSADPNNPYFSTRNFEGTAGGEAKAIVHDSIVIDATVNPDFSQVESDQPQFTVNQRYPVYFPELRPFFLENANYFSTPINLLYTRNIVHPEFGVRVTGKLDHTNIGLLTIDDRAPGETFAPGDPDYGKHALFAVGRVYPGHSARAPASARSTPTMSSPTASTESAVSISPPASTTNGPPSGKSSKAPQKLCPARASTPAFSARRTRPRRKPAPDPPPGSKSHARAMPSLSTTSTRTIPQTSPPQVGFIQVTDIRNDHGTPNTSGIPKHSGLQSFGLETSGHVSWDHAGNRVEHQTTIDPFFLLPRKTTIAPLLIFNSDTLGPAGWLRSSPPTSTSPRTPAASSSGAPPCASSTGT